MTRTEFEKLTLRNGGHISQSLYNIVERFYSRENDYHANHGGNNETKQNFCKRVFQGKVNTPKTILSKIIDEAIKENRYALQGCNVTKQRLDDMDIQIKEYLTWEASLEY